ncbi:hypothetical protein V8J82_01360 [Gymnodinialimonas sp. 2305UL16-5]|uniref:hypothetical protein n=1 Tax=Gymnodinialimonas mytili TaxID=3126503 RepID=UPI003099CBAB
MAASLPRHMIQARLEALLTVPSLPASEYASGARLLDALQNPARVSILSPYPEDGLWLLQCMLLHEVLPAEADVIPTLELSYRATPRLRATLEDGSKVTRAGWPSMALMDEGPIYMDLEVPIEALETMSVLLVPLGTDAFEQRAALNWAAKRSEVAIWCAPFFTGADAQMWLNAPERLSYHAFAVLTGGGPGDGLPREVGFDGVFRTDPHDPAESQWQISRLMTQLLNDISEAQRHDIDAAELFLHRFAHLLPDDAAPTDPAPQPDAELTTDDLFADLADDTRSPAPPPPELVDAISEPMLFLRRRARALIELLDWEPGEDWPHMVLSHCVETTEGLRDRAVRWPDTTAAARRLMRRVEDACDTAVLLQIEAGEDQARDAAQLLTQIREEFEDALVA